MYSYKVYQMPISNISKFRSFDETKENIRLSDYVLVYCGKLDYNDEDFLDEIFYRLNAKRPKDYYAHSLSCSDVEYDGNIFYIYNVDKYKDLWEYKGIEKEDVYILTYDNEVFKVEEVETYDWFDWCEVQEQFCLMEINTLEELLDMMNNFEKSIIIEEPWEYDVYNNLKRIKIYDGWNE